MSMRTKLVTATVSLIAILLLSSVISVMEYKRMSNYVSEQVHANITSINMAHNLLSVADQYNLDILTKLGDDIYLSSPQVPDSLFLAQLDSLTNGLQSEESLAMADSVKTAYHNYIANSLQYEDAYNATFLDLTTWYYDELQPSFLLLRGRIENLVNMAYDEFTANSEAFQAGFYRSIMPGVVSVGAGIMLVLLMMFYLMIYYVNPICKMHSKLKNYREHSLQYNYEFEGDDQLSGLNEDIRDIATENYELRKRLRK